MGKKLFEDASDEEVETVQLKTNKEYAKSYNKFRQKELLKKLKDRDENSEDSDTSSESESTDDEIVINRKFDEEFLKTLASLKRKDPCIYDKNTTFFENVEDDDLVKSKSSKSKPLTLKDYERQVILDKGGVYEDEEESCGEEKHSQSPTCADEEKELKEEFKKALNSDTESSEEEFGGIFKKREKSKEEKQKEEAEYIEWLAGRKENLEEETKEKLNPLKQYWSKPDLPKEEVFLRDYILNNGYINKDDDEIPTYEQIVGDDCFSDDEKELERQEEFEHKYNYRFEEPDQEFIKRYPRTIENSVRKKDDKRKMKREEMKERKKKEKEQKFKEIEMLKELKRKEIEEKIQKLKEVTGNEDLPFQDEDLEEEFDPEQHDKRMREIFNNDFYQVDEGEEKPECPDIDELKVEDWDNFDPNNDYADDDRYNYEPHCEDDDFNMDCEYDPNSKEKFQTELIENTKDKRKRRRRRNRFMEMIKKEKPHFNPEDEKTYAEYIDEYYKMDCEDIIDDIPCRFKYVETTPNDFGLTIEEILLAKNKELNQWASMKKTMQIRSKKDELRDVKMYRMKAKNEALKRKIFVSLYGPPSEDEDEKVDESKNNSSENQHTEGNGKRKKRKKKAKSSNLSNENNASKIPKLENNQTMLETNNETVAVQEVSNPSKEIDTKSHDKDKKTFSELNKNSKSVKAETKLNITSKKNKSEHNLSQIKKKKFKTNSKSADNPLSHISDDRIQAYGLNPKKVRRKQNFLNRQTNQTNKKRKMNTAKKS